MTSPNSPGAAGSSGPGTNNISHVFVSGAGVHLRVAVVIVVAETVTAKGTALGHVGKVEKVVHVNGESPEGQFTLTQTL